MMNFFVDSCIFFAYAYPGEKWNSKSTTFLNSGFDRFTGLRVKTEINCRLQRRKEFYKRLAAFLFDGGKLKNFDTSYIANNNDRRHFEELLLFLATRFPSDILSYIRDKDNITRKGIGDALGRIQAPLIGMSYDPICENIVQTLVENRSDAQIFVDAYCWSEKKGTSVFATTDVNDFVKNRVHIHKALCNYKSLDRVEDLPLKIFHLDEIV